MLDPYVAAALVALVFAVGVVGRNRIDTSLLARLARENGWREPRIRRLWRRPRSIAEVFYVNPYRVTFVDDAGEPGTRECAVGMFYAAKWSDDGEPAQPSAPSAAR